MLCDGSVERKERRDGLEKKIVKKQTTTDQTVKVNSCNNLKWW